ncbi:enoyl-CoA hydratase/isomerase family protein [Aquabacter cavernae]|uniref:enoyl-CoA hydratase/isomerase family protein n=1 Tax=Aquabacter cavernae TaxID=2496029 RepID=UPI001FE1B97E|nr:enoyl-CoA hydratase/isomerase family protein [Aquabacter cavernae]
MPRLIRVERQGPAAIITFQRPEAMNSWTQAMRAEIIDAMAQADADPAVRAVIFTGAGPRAFGAGQDLKEPGPTLAEADAWIDQWARLFGTLRGLSKPSIAALNGVAAGSSFQFALMADFRVAHDGVRMGQPEINSGVASAMGPWIIREMLGPAYATDLCLSGRIMGNEECRRLGLFNRVVTAEEVVPEAVRLAGELAAKPERAMGLTKARLRGFGDAGFREAIDLWRAMLRQTLESA